MTTSKLFSCEHLHWGAHVRWLLLGTQARHPPLLVPEEQRLWWVTVHSQCRAHGRSKPLSRRGLAPQPRSPATPATPSQTPAAISPSPALPARGRSCGHHLRHSALPRPGAPHSKHCCQVRRLAWVFHHHCLSKWRPWEPCPSLALGQITNCKRGHGIRQGAGPQPFTHCPASAPTP